jgi:hypothetical protein
VRLTQLVLVSQKTHREQTLKISTSVTRDTLRQIADDESRYASSPQFVLYRDHEETFWQVEHSATATHPTFLNDVQLCAGRHQLKSGDVISIGGKRLFLTVRLERFEQHQ